MICCIIDFLDFRVLVVLFGLLIVRSSSCVFELYISLDLLVGGLWLVGLVYGVCAVVSGG